MPQTSENAIHLQPPAPAERPVILIVDDEPSVRALVEAALSIRRNHYTVVQAGNGTEALELAGRQLPDLVLLDVGLPDLDGFSICQALKTNPITAHALVVMLTAMNLPSDRARATEVGADGYIVKPFSPRGLIALLEEKLARFATPSSK